MRIQVNGISVRLTLRAFRHGDWVDLPETSDGDTARYDWQGLRAEVNVRPAGERCGYTVRFTSFFSTRVRLWLEPEEDLGKPFHLIPGNIHGDNNAAHVRPGEFPVLTELNPAYRNCAPLWEFRADRASHPVSMLCFESAAIGIAVEPYSDCKEADEGFIRNGVFAALPAACGISVGYGNDPMTFSEKTRFLNSTADLSHGASASGTIYALKGNGRAKAHDIIRTMYGASRELPTYTKTHRQALRALADTFANVNWSPELQQYTNRKCLVPVDTTMRPWRAIVEIGWTGGSMTAYPFALAERIFPDLKMPKSSAAIFDEICEGYNAASGFINDTTINRSTRNIPEGWNGSAINGWWSGFLPQTCDNHCSYTNAHAAYYLLRTAWTESKDPLASRGGWVKTALKVLDTAVDLQRDDGAFGYIFSSTEKKVVDWEGFAGCWFAAALPYAWQITGDTRYRDSTARALRFYRPYIQSLAAWGSPMDTFKSIDSEGNLAFIRAARLMHEFTGEPHYLEMLKEGAEYEYLWRYGFRTRPQCPPLQGGHWNSCGGTITSVSNPHIHPMGVVATEDLLYLANVTDDDYHRMRADDGIAWLMNTMELYPDRVGYGQYGLLSERTCPSDGLLAEKYYDTGVVASSWWSYNAWAAASAMEAIAERILATEPTETKR